MYTATNAKATNVASPKEPGENKLYRNVRLGKDYFMEYEQGLHVEDQELITRNYKEKNTNGQECSLKKKRRKE
jgi:hypothetical protein